MPTYATVAFDAHSLIPGKVICSSLLSFLFSADVKESWGQAGLRGEPAGQLPGATKHPWNKSGTWCQVFQNIGLKGCQIIGLPGAPTSRSGSAWSFTSTTPITSHEIFMVSENCEVMTEILKI
jgi:hypothetical protein